MGNLLGSGFGVQGELRADGRRPGTAAVLSFLIPGLGQFYNGAFLRGIFWLIVAPGVWFVSATTLGWVCHIVAAYTAYKYAERRGG
jgi:TM2 domain-containing membrane protein YozV